MLLQLAVPQHHHHQALALWDLAPSIGGWRGFRRVGWGWCGFVGLDSKSAQHKSWPCRLAGGRLARVGA
jgi:hypothetical protein